jgi:signal peptidase I
MDIIRYYVKRCIVLPSDTFEIRQGINKVRGVEETLGNIERQRILPHAFMPTEGWQEKGVFSQDSLLKGSLLEFGPLYLPAQGDEIAMNRKHHSLYKHLIEWEQKEKLTLKGDSVWLGDSLIQSYRFQDNYYFVAGDRATSSRDSRYWGLLTEAYIVGVATLIWKSVGTETGNVRCKRVMKTIE